MKTLTDISINLYEKSKAYLSKCYPYIDVEQICLDALHGAIVRFKGEPNQFPLFYYKRLKYRIINELKKYKKEQEILEKAKDLYFSYEKDFINEIEIQITINKISYKYKHKDELIAILEGSSVSEIAKEKNICRTALYSSLKRFKKALSKVLKGGV